MNKVIAAVDGLKLSESTIDYSIYLAGQFNAHIVAAFLEDITYHAKPGGNEYDFVLTDWSEMDTVIKKEHEVKAEAKIKLQKKFDAAGIHYNIHTGKAFALEALLNESYYADLILIDGNEVFSNIDYSKPSRFLKNLLSGSHCPVIVAPAVFKPVERFVLAYDGSPSSIYAIKQSSYLFSHEQVQEVEILIVSDDKHTNHLPNEYLLKELLKHKYPAVARSIIKSSNPDEAFVNHLKAENKNCMLILGAYQRNSFSRWLYQSIADALIYELDVPLFIAHK